MPAQIESSNLCHDILAKMIFYLPDQAIWIGSSLMTGPIRSSGMRLFQEDVENKIKNGSLSYNRLYVLKSDDEYLNIKDIVISEIASGMNVRKLIDSSESIRDQTFLFRPVDASLEAPYLDPNMLLSALCEELGEVFSNQEDYYLSTAFRLQIDKTSSVTSIEIIKSDRVKRALFLEFRDHWRRSDDIALNDKEISHES